jgi:hypothetical protein
VEDEDLTPDHFNSISRIIEYIDGKQKGAGVSAGD